MIQTPATAIQVNVQQPSRAAHSLGISSLVLGILSFFVCWIPFVGLPLSGLGFLLGAIGLILAITRKGTGIGYSIAGTALNSFGLLSGIIFITLIAGMFKAVDSAMDELAEDMKSHQAQSAETGPIWTRADTPLELGNAQLRITEVVIGNVPFWLKNHGNAGQSEKKLLIIWLEITNISENKKIDYQGWMTINAYRRGITAELTYNHRNRYKQEHISPLKVKDTETNTSIHPGKSIQDAIVYELPIEGIEYLRLKLSAKGCKEEGEFRFEILDTMISQE